MKIRFLTVVLLLLCFVTCAGAQGNSKNSRTPVIFAVLNGGSTLEPIAYLKEGKLESAVDGASDADVLKKFHTDYFKRNSSYDLIFGGQSAGLVTVKSSNPDNECSRHTADVFTTTTATKLKGNVMALASSIKASGSGTRRLPTATERAEAEALVRKELLRKKVSSAAVTKLRSQNLTAVDVDNDDVAELVGSYWVAPSPKSRALLFFIAQKNSDGRYGLTLSDFQLVNEKDTMSEDITAVDTGVYHELLLDVLDYDGDGTGEIFTQSASFEGTGFNAYRLSAGKWLKVFEDANYRCAY